MGFFKRKHFDVLKVIEFEPGIDMKETNWRNSYTLTCYNRNKVEETYADNSDFSLSFPIFNDGSSGFKAIRPGSLIDAGDQLFVVQTITQKYAGATTATVNATQVVNAWFDRVQQNKPLIQKSDDVDDSDASSTSDSNRVAHVDLQALLDWFLDGTNMYVGPRDMSFRFHQVGYFPVRPVKGARHWSGKQLLTHITEIWPGTLIYPFGFDIYICGYKQKRDENGDLVRIVNNDTGLRFDAMANASDVEVTTDMSRMCNAIEVKAATYSRKSDNNDDGEDDGNEFVNQNIPYFKPFVASSQRSIAKYGLFASPDVLDNGFTVKNAALQAAREKMVLDPVVTVKAKIDHPGQTELCPSPGDSYSIGTRDKVYLVRVCGYRWYPFDSSKGCELTLNNVDPGILDTLKTTIVHDTELSPTVTAFKMLSDDNDDNDDYDDGSDDGGDDSGDDSGDSGSGDDSQDQGDTGLPQVNSDPGTDRPNDQAGPNGTSENLPSFRAYLPISDHGTHAHISSFGNFTVNKNNDDWNIRVSDSKHLAHLRDGNWSKDDENNSQWKHLMKIDWAQHLGTTFNGSNYYADSDYYFGQNTWFRSALLTTTSSAFTFRDHVKDSDYHNGKLRHYSYVKGNVRYYVDNDNRNPGKLATIQAGYIDATNTARSRLSLKENVKKLDKEHALKTINDTDIATYNYKEDDDKQTQASLIIDDVNKKKKWSAPKELLTEDGLHRNDSKTLGYLIAAVQALTDKVNNQNDEIDELKQQIKEIKKQLKD